MTPQTPVQLISTLSPMTSLVDIGDTFILPTSHGEGNFYMKNLETLEKYIKKGQIVIQYLDVE